jgi:site-specific DNA-methyltransferase (adenine-specific)
MAADKNTLYYGDNLEVLRRYVKPESVDLVYLDPPFNSRQDYNVLFAEKDGSQSSSQIHAFEDTWEWNIESQRALEQVIEQGGDIADALRAFKTFLFNSDMMAPRLVELPYVVKDFSPFALSVNCASNSDFSGAFPSRSAVSTSSQRVWTTAGDRMRYPPSGCRSKS